MQEREPRVNGRPLVLPRVPDTKMRPPVDPAGAE
jgi:hypothetical protein